MRYSQMYINILHLQGSVAADLKCGEILKGCFIAHLLLSAERVTERK